jgi:dienelactone hydrolase
MQSQSLHYSDGTRNFDSLLVSDGPLAEPRPGVIVFPEAWGLGEHAIERAERLAKEGYIALAVDPWGDRAQTRDLARLRELMGDLMTDPALRRSRTRLSYDALLAQPGVDASRIAAIGFCLGGTFALELARSGASLAAAVCFHGGLDTALPAEPGAVKAKLLVCAGADDKSSPFSQVDGFLAEMRAAGADHQVIAYGHTVHSFTNPAADGSMPGFKYDAVSDRRSWTAMRNLFDEVFTK